MRGRAVVDTGDLLLRPGSVLVGDGLVQDGAVAGHPTEVVDLGDLYLVPGLVDAHVHLTLDADSDDQINDFLALDDEALTRRAAAAARQALQAGVTTVRDLGDRDYLVARLAAERRPDLPTILSAGPPVTVRGGHCAFMGGAVDPSTDPADLVRERVAGGAHLVKVMVNGGILTPGSTPADLQFDATFLERLVGAARAARLPVAAHAHTAAGIALAYTAGMSTLEHCTFADEDTNALDRDLVDTLARDGVWVSPTYVERPGLTWDPLRFAWRADVLRALHAAGVPLAGGTDAGVKRGLFPDTGAYVPAAFAAAGLTPAEALRACTLDAATACGRDRAGRLIPGWAADLLGVRQNPLLIPLRPEDIVVVVARGQVIRDDRNR